MHEHDSHYTPCWLTSFLTAYVAIPTLQHTHMHAQQWLYAATAWSFLPAQWLLQGHFCLHAPRNLETSRLLPTLECACKVHSTVALSSHCVGISAHTAALRGIHCVTPPRDLETSRLLPALQYTHRECTTVAQSGHRMGISAHTVALRGIHIPPTKRITDIKATTHTAMHTQGTHLSGSKWPQHGHFCLHSGSQGDPYCPH